MGRGEGLKIRAHMMFMHDDVMMPIVLHSEYILINVQIETSQFVVCVHACQKYTMIFHLTIFQVY